MKQVLIANSGSIVGRTFCIDKSEVTLGRSPDNDIQVEDRSISHRHCLFRTVETRTDVCDLGSHNGTFVNGLRIREQTLSDGDLIIVGQIAFLFRRFDPDAVEPLDAEFGWPSSPTIVEPGVPMARETLAVIWVREIVRSLQSAYLERLSDERTGDGGGPFDWIVRLIPSRRGLLALIDTAGEPAILIEYREQPALPAATLDTPIATEIVRRSATMTGQESTTPWIGSPIGISGTVTGILYLDSYGVDREYSHDDLSMISALAEVLGLALENARDIETLRYENARLNTASGLADGLIGSSPAIRNLSRTIAKVARGNSTVLIRGESGTGKELVARAIHRKSDRSAKPFVSINCAAITETLLESELFGSEKGAFTGAVAQRKGKLEAADGGTVFLDEVGELAPTLQAKLLRVLQEREFERVGGTKPIRVDIRLIAATNRDLEKAMRDGRFREDLFFRLNVLPLRTPALRDRREDIPVLAEYFLKKFSDKLARDVRGFSREAHACLMAYSWPGNVRELQNVIERAVVLGSSDRIGPDDLPAELLDSIPGQEPGENGFHARMRELRRRVIASALDSSKGNVAEAARRLKLHPVYLHRLITNLGLRDNEVDHD